MNPESLRRPRIPSTGLIIGFVIVVGSILSFLAYRQVADLERERAETEFYRRADVRQALTREILSYYESGVFALRNLFVGDDAVSRGQFLQVARDIIGRYEGITALEWVAVVPGRDRAAFELAMGRELGRQFTLMERDNRQPPGLVPAQERAEYLPVTYLEPLSANEAALGLDLSTGPSRDSLALARRDNRMVVTAVFDLIQGQRGVLMIWPVYRKGSALTAARGQFLGFAQGVFRVGELFEQTQKRDPTTNIDALYLDASASDPAARVLYYRPGDDRAARQPAPGEAEFRAGLHREHVINLGGRNWVVLYRPTPAWLQGQMTNLPLMRFGGGLLITGLLAGLIGALARRTATIEALVAARTAELSESRRQTESILAQLPGMAFRCLGDERFTPIYISSGALELTGHTVEDFLSGRVWYEDLIEPSDRPIVTSTTLNAVAQHKPFEVEYRLRLRDGREKWVLDRGAGVFGDDGRLLFIEGLAVDITQRKQAEADKIALERKLLESQKLESLGVLAGGIAHDFNNLLTAIMGNASLARLELGAGSPIQKNLRQIETTSLRAAELCQQMLAYSGRSRFVVERLDLSALVEGAAPLLQFSLGRHASFRLELPRGLPPVMGDATQLRQIVMNLVMNASEAMGEKAGEITLATGVCTADRDFLAATVNGGDLPAGEYLFLRVEDQGCGMSAETLARIFDPFFTTKFAGRGLGLAAVLGIVRSHEGALQVTSVPGRGTTFTLLLPPTDGTAVTAPDSPGTVTPWQHSGTVLVADDEDEVRQIASDILEKLGFTVVSATDGHEAVQAFEREPSRFDLVLLDLTMPGVSGVEALRRMRGRRPDLPALMMSGYAETEAEARLAGLTSARFLQKPFTVASLVAIVQAMFKPKAG